MKYNGKGYGLKILNFNYGKKKSLIIKRLDDVGLKIIVDGISVVNDVFPFGL